MRVGITGHRGLSTEVEERVRALLADAVSGYDAAELVAVSCIADGPDAVADELVAVWDGKPAWGHGGTADVVAYAERTGVRVRVLWPEDASR
ncbi:hypothetical protein [Streptomyces sp. NPDC002520]